MDVTCEKCQSKFVVPDNKIPKGQKVSIPCPKCKQPLTIEQKPEASTQNQKPKPQPAASTASTASTTSTASTASTASTSSPPQSTSVNGTDSSSYDSSENPFDFLEEGVETALICESDTGIRDKIKAVLDKMGYKSVSPPSPRDALKQMRFHEFNLIVINERFGTRDPDMNHVLKYLSQVPMSSRRNMFVVLLTDRFRSTDAMMAYNKSVNTIVNLSNINDFEKIIKKGINDHKFFYRIFKESLAKIGKA